ncbi:unnamed protein product [Oikopleura dioica]|uniref:Uncharacterized protein n=1 Tax=Oikopleura dioica TaxID=34765 RepID=E4X5T6_OIKDI|nr:unnamed protein product [Oikopleura dioica]
MRKTQDVLLTAENIFWEFSQIILFSRNEGEKKVYYKFLMISSSPLVSSPPPALPSLCPSSSEDTLLLLIRRSTSSRSREAAATSAAALSATTTPKVSPRLTVTRVAASPLLPARITSNKVRPDINKEKLSRTLSNILSLVSATSRTTSPCSSGPALSPKITVPSLLCLSHQRATANGCQTAPAFSSAAGATPPPALSETTQTHSNV